MATLTRISKNNSRFKTLAYTDDHRQLTFSGVADRIAVGFKNELPESQEQKYRYTVTIDHQDLYCMIMQVKVKDLIERLGADDAAEWLRLSKKALNI